MVRSPSSSNHRQFNRWSEPRAVSTPVRVNVPVCGWIWGRKCRRARKRSRTRGGPRAVSSLCAQTSQLGSGQVGLATEASEIKTASRVLRVDPGSLLESIRSWTEVEVTGSIRIR